MAESKFEVVEKLRTTEGWTVFEQRMVGQRVWQVRRQGGEYRRISVWTLVKEGRAWSVSVQDEAADLVAVDCPVEFLDMAPQPQGGSGDWRARVREAADQASLGREWAVSLLHEAREGDTLFLKPGLRPEWVRVTGSGPSTSIYGDAPSGVRTKVGWRQFGKLVAGERRGARVAPVYAATSEA